MAGPGPTPPHDTYPISDAELTKQALAADSDAPMENAVPFASVIGSDSVAALPSWYMPAPMSGGPRLRGWRRGTVLLFIASLLVIEAAGLCSTYGQII